MCGQNCHLSWISWWLNCVRYTNTPNAECRDKKRAIFSFPFSQIYRFLSRIHCAKFRCVYAPASNSGLRPHIPCRKQQQQRKTERQHKISICVRLAHLLAGSLTGWLNVCILCCYFIQLILSFVSSRERKIDTFCITHTSCKHTHSL